MKTALEWAEYLPEGIKEWFIIECTKFGKENDSRDNLRAIIYYSFNWDETELGEDFWEGVYDNALSYTYIEYKIAKDLEWIDNEEGIINNEAKETDFTQMVSNVECELTKQLAEKDKEISSLKDKLKLNDECNSEWYLRLDKRNRELEKENEFLNRIINFITK